MTYRVCNFPRRHASPTGGRRIFENLTNVIFVSSASPQTASSAEKPIMETFARSRWTRNNVRTPLRQRHIHRVSLFFFGGPVCVNFAPCICDARYDRIESMLQSRLPRVAPRL